MTQKDALNIICNEFIDLYGQDLIDFRFEEIENINQTDFYVMTVSFLLPDKNPPASLTTKLANGNRLYERLYKTIKINKSDSSIISIKMFNKN